MNSQRLVVTLLSLLLLGLLGWFAYQLEWVEKSVDNGYGPEARKNPYLAAKFYLDKQGIATQALQGLNKLDDLPPPAVSTLVMVSSQRSLNKARLDGLWQWVKAGGHLITNTTTFTDPESGRNLDALVTALGLGVYPVDHEEEVSSEALPSWVTDIVSQGKTHCLPEVYIFDVKVEEEKQPLKVALKGHVVMVDHSETARASAANQHGAQLMQYKIGEGLITVLSDLSLWTNNKIACYDHAYLLSVLVGTGEAWILHHIEMPSITALIWHHAPLAASLFILLLILWLWRRSRRFGPLITLEESRRRSLMEHIYASSMFAWRSGHVERLVGELQQAILLRMRGHHPGFNALESAEQYGVIARTCHLSPAEVEQAMAMPPPKSAHALVHTVQLLQTIRNAL